MCDKKCDCKTCRNSTMCKECYVMKRCTSGGITNCEGYVPHNFLKRLWWYIIGELNWQQL